MPQILMALDWPSHFAAGMIGFCVGICANIAYGRCHAGLVRAELKRKYAGIAGDYTAYLFLEGSDKIDYEKPRGNCRITYEKENTFHLRYQEIEHDHTWEAVVWMETPFFGSLAWRYVRLRGHEPCPEHRHGFKRCIAGEGFGRNGEPRTYFYLEGEPPFGKEALEKNE